MTKYLKKNVKMFLNMSIDFISKKKFFKSQRFLMFLFVKKQILFIFSFICHEKTHNKISTVEFKNCLYV